MAGYVIGGGPTVCVVGKSGCEEVLCRVVVVRCGSGESGRMSAGGAEGTREDAESACGESSRSCVKEIEGEDGGVRGKAYVYIYIYLNIYIYIYIHPFSMGCNGKCTAKRAVISKRPLAQL